MDIGRVHAEKLGHVVFAWLVIIWGLPDGPRLQKGGAAMSWLPDLRERERRRFAKRFYFIGLAVCAVIELGLLIPLMTYWSANDAMTFMQLLKTRPILCAGLLFIAIIGQGFNRGYTEARR
jgi:hypothetical protein